MIMTSARKITAEVGELPEGTLERLRGLARALGRALGWHAARYLRAEPHNLTDVLGALAGGACAWARDVRAAYLKRRLS